MNLRLAALLVTVLSIWSCEDDEASVEIFFDPDVSSSSTNLGQTVTFTDYSTGVESRVWTFPSGTPATSTEKEVDVQFSEVA